MINLRSYPVELRRQLRTRMEAAAGDLPDVRVLRARRRALKGVAERTTLARVERTTHQPS
ncbi:MAG: hypothetical protein M3Y44_13085 [Actinomycetota bacterium]|nr:hypothetical protein [Actinomycetota bacterium]